MYAQSTLDFAYRYPFSKDAKSIITDLNPGIEYAYLEMAKNLLDNCINSTNSFSSVRNEQTRLNNLISYAYARMIVSAVNIEPLTYAFARGSTERSVQALKGDSNDNTIKLAGMLGIAIELNANTEFLVRLQDFLMNAPSSAEFKLVNQRLKDGIVLLRKEQLVQLLNKPIYKAVRTGLPISKTELPKEVLTFSKEAKFAIKWQISEPIQPRRGATWIDRLLSNPISDVRHRVVNLILAPYLVNVRRLSVDDAYKIITDYIEKCKKLNPDTKLNETYIRYQCNYAKNRGLRPLSLRRAKELLSGLIDFEIIQNTKGETK